MFLASFLNVCFVEHEFLRWPVNRDFWGHLCILHPSHWRYTWVLAYWRVLDFPHDECSLAFYNPELLKLIWSCVCVYVCVYAHMCASVHLVNVHLVSLVLFRIYFGKLIAPSLYGKLNPSKVYFSLQVIQLLAEMWTYFSVPILPLPFSMIAWIHRWCSTGIAVILLLPWLLESSLPSINSSLRWTQRWATPSSWRSLGFKFCCNQCWELESITSSLNLALILPLPCVLYPHMTTVRVLDAPLIAECIHPLQAPFVNH